MNNLQQLLESITPDIYERLKLAVEIGKWPDGNRLTSEQRELCMQAVISYEHKHLPAEAHTGYIPPKPHQHCGSDDDSTAEPDAETPLKWQ
ncbi:YeaC family protein [Gilvimarinus agarilyticus]|uniref:YeaC family protein n=1 Tax=Gilvimarinus agarilyticus TaxID=679259 RepID=UPI0005A12D5A|nr:YeaC family protein [Gilvimarinus agarilyticus]